jgi:fructose-1,6-bisphosphatase/inositol monophosphatase family enzyme
MSRMLMDEVIPALTAIADAVILPRFRALQAGEVEEKSPGEVVTIADREAEIRIAAVLRGLRPDAVVIGEEAVAECPALLAAMETEAACWLIDPLDGTQNFVNGSADFAVMVALVEGGETVASWMWMPLDRVAYVAERGAGAFRNGERQQVDVLTNVPTLADLHGVVDVPGAVLDRFLTAEQRAALAEIAPFFGGIGTGSRCTGVDYPLIVAGRQRFVRYERLSPWDHAPGTLFLEEAGGCVRRWDGSAYAPGRPGTGLLAASDPATWELVREALRPALG